MHLRIERNERLPALGWMAQFDQVAQKLSIEHGPRVERGANWIVEGVWDGELEITQYELLERDGDRFRFRAAGGMHAGPGSAGSLIPPHEYHTIRNTSADAVAVSLHIYKAPMESCSMFVPNEGEWFARVAKTLQTDQAA